MIGGGREGFLLSALGEKRLWVWSEDWGEMLDVLAHVKRSGTLSSSEGTERASAQTSVSLAGSSERCGGFSQLSHEVKLTSQTT